MIRTCNHQHSCEFRQMLQLAIEDTFLKMYSWLLQSTLVPSLRCCCQIHSFSYWYCVACPHIYICSSWYIHTRTLAGVTEFMHYEIRYVLSITGHWITYGGIHVQWNNKSYFFHSLFHPPTHPLVVCRRGGGERGGGPRDPQDLNCIWKWAADPKVSIIGRLWRPPNQGVS